MEQKQQRLGPPKITIWNIRQKNHLPLLDLTKLRDFASTLSFFKKHHSCKNNAPLKLECVFLGVKLHAQTGTVRTKTAASDLQTTAYFLGQLRDYVHLKSSEEGGRGEVEPRSCLFFVPIGPT